MPQKSKGSRQGTRKKLTKKERERGAIPVTRSIREFEEDDRVHIIIDSAIQKGMPHPRFHGKTGRVLEKRGQAYVVEVTDKNDKKKLTVRPEHLKPQQG
ncbi:50S ribosomal protein L21e [Methanonatronarchaeum sp. AMET-Sl]|uniref:50S ribosomal protein L21e n=1 Tax=Methanonatronarchaeum sp. AMET-Sl TaxID=3037654 RepID=UPI00244E21CF|nr:50S ribosomal protein L21e [Methanonatronarchaeum sp. AMET-Sl]WGI16762.1 50S ribosomal protein L21e [Methanonatronarchaeum sp. AMET-Sl]